jgi:putative Holliday junction resolvase
MRVLGVDFGTKRVGLAVSDETGTLATPLDTLSRREGKRPPLAAIERIGKSLGVEHVVVGLPLDLQGAENAWCQEVRDVGRRIGERLGVGVSFVDERMTSVQATRVVRGSGLPKHEREQKERVDAAAARLILQAWLDAPGIAR